MLLALLGLTLLVPSSSLGIVQIAEIDGEQASEIDSRTAALPPTTAQTAAVERLGAEVRWNEFGTPQSLVKHGGFLAANLKAGDAADAARAWVEANRSLFRLDSLAGLELQNDVRLTGSNGHAVVFRQRIGGLTTAADGVLVVGVVGSAKRGWDVAYVSSRVIGDTTLAGTAELSPVEAWVESAQKVGESVSTGDVSVAGREKGWTLLDVEGFEQPQSVRAAAFPTPGSGPVRAYETTVLDTPPSGQIEGYWQVLDADTGAVLFRESIVDHAVDNPTWKVFPAYPQLTAINEHPWNYPSADTRDLWCWDDMPGCQLAVANPAARVPWDTNARTGTPTFTTIGNAADSFEQWFSPQDEAPGTGYRPTSPTRDYDYPWTNVWFETRCDPANFVVGSGNDIDAAVTNLFAMHNRMHDWSYFLGFTEQRWNAQDFNFGSPTLENDRLLGRAQSGAVVPKSRDNANMATRPDGESSITNMFLWQPVAGAFYAPCVDGDYDMAVIGHEYGHMIENRMIGKGERRRGDHAGAMGESFGDLNAAEYLNEYNFVPVGGENPFAVGAYVTGNPIRAIRNFDMAFPSTGEFPTAGRTPMVNPLNFGAVAYDIVGEQVHADGEIW
ncbi:MAG TPA: M36 family metallopeptidase, partial [Gaiellaceae bacterium]|nr:M36 family metallopeptidase [Gaiellaceae bacterium]